MIYRPISLAPRLMASNESVPLSLALSGSIGGTAGMLLTKLVSVQMEDNRMNRASEWKRSGKRLLFSVDWLRVGVGTRAKEKERARERHIQE